MVRSHSERSHLFSSYTASPKLLFQKLHIYDIHQISNQQTFLFMFGFLRNKLYLRILLSVMFLNIVGIVFSSYCMLILPASNTQGDSMDGIDLFSLTLISIEKKQKFAPQEFERILLFSLSCTISSGYAVINEKQQYYIIRLSISLILIFLYRAKSLIQILLQIQVLIRINALAFFSASLPDL